MLADNLGWGEPGCYGGGALRGAPTPHIDRLAEQGIRLQNFNVESDCVSTRSALMTGRHPIRTGCLQSVPAGLPQGLTRWERTLPELLSAQGYATAHYGKWHLGDIPGRFPSDRGFDEWYGIPRTTNESQFTSEPGYDAEVTPLPYIMHGRRGEASTNVKVYDLESRRRIDAELVERALAFMGRSAAAGQPFFLYLPFVHLHFPTLPHPDFAGRSRAGDFADSMIELDHRVGQVLAAVDALGIAQDTLVIFCSDNGPEFRVPYRGTAGPWRGTYHTAMEGSLRVPFLARFPGRIAPGRVSNEIIHVTDLLPTLAALAGAKVPDDRPIDGVDQREFFFGGAEKSAREGFPFYIKNELRAVKWRDWKLHLHWEPEVNEGKGKLESPYLFNLTRDPKEEVNVAPQNSWVMSPIRRLIHAFNESCKQFPNSPPGAPD
jgi:arylsulfatase